MPDSSKEEKKPKERIQERKWASLKARGYTPPADAAENKQRAKDAHGY